MKNIFKIRNGSICLINRALWVMVALAGGLMAASCTDKCELDRRYTYYKPVYTSTEEIRNSVVVGQPRQINRPGKIYYKEGILFINEVGEGIHIVDNTNPKLPRMMAFVAIPGNFDMAAKGDYLYTDSYVDLVVFNISDVNRISQVARVESAFQNFSNLPFYFDVEKGVVTSYEEVTTQEVAEIDCETIGSIRYPEGDVAIFDTMEKAGNFAATKGSAPGAQAGVGGSMARFAIYDHYLYTIDQSALYLFDITSLNDPKAGPKVDIGWGIETLFPYGDKLFVGANNGMHIFDNASPSAPQHLSTYEHVTSCDPVVVDGDYAYVTLRSSNSCFGRLNQLDIVDISDLKNPKLAYTYPMQNPHGLGVDGKCLFICEGVFGLKQFDRTDLKKIDLNLVAHFDNVYAFDVIPLDGLLMMIGNDGLYQYAYDCEGKPELLSTIPVLKL